MSHSEQVQYLPLAQFEYDYHTPNGTEMLPPGIGGSEQTGASRSDGEPMPQRTAHHTSGHKNFATFSAVPAPTGPGVEGAEDPSFLHYMAVAMSLTSTSAAAFGVPKVMAFSIPGWLESLKMSRTTLSAIISAGNLAGAVTQPWLGRMVDTWGPRMALSGMLACMSIAFTAPAFAADMSLPVMRIGVMVIVQRCLAISSQACMHTLVQAI
jgi:predicted MFS family arabinose efflux permease